MLFNAVLLNEAEIFKSTTLKSGAMLLKYYFPQRFNTFCNILKKNLLLNILYSNRYSIWEYFRTHLTRFHFFIYWEVENPASINYLNFFYFFLLTILYLYFYPKTNWKIICVTNIFQLNSKLCVKFFLKMESNFILINDIDLDNCFFKSFSGDLLTQQQFAKIHECVCRPTTLLWSIVRSKEMQ